MIDMKGRYIVQAVIKICACFRNSIAMFTLVSVFVAACAVASPVLGKGHHRRSHSAPPGPLLSPEEFPPLGPTGTSLGPPRFYGPSRGPYPPEPVPHLSSPYPEDYPPLGPAGDGPPVGPVGAWSGAPRDDFPPLGPSLGPPSPPPRRRRPSRPHSPSRSPSPSSAPAEDSYTHLVLAIQWHGGVCADGKSDDRPCLRESKRDHWTIHGLWPSSDYNSPSYCTREEFDGRRLEHVKGQLNQLWPSFTSTQDRYFTFWRHQWQKHGTCAGDIPQLRGLTNFFENAIKLAKQHDIKRYLENSNVKPNDRQSYQPAQIMKAISDDFPYKFDVVCSESKNTGRSVLSEVRFCYDKQLKPTNCKGRSVRCGNQVYYLPPK